MTMESRDLLRQISGLIHEVKGLGFGEVTKISKLRGIKAFGGCYNVQCEGKNIILKESLSSCEYEFYNYVQKYRDIKNVPKLYFSKKVNESYWIALEYITMELPRERWYGDEKVIDAIFYLHHNTWDRDRFQGSVYTPSWSEELTYKTLELYNKADRKEIKDKLHFLYNEGQQLFERKCWISGDTNPTNWGVKENGAVINYDWERISAGTPAIDLAITMPGLGSLDGALEEKIAKYYVKQWNKMDLSFYLSTKELIKQVKLAKIWSVMEFLDNSMELLKEKSKEILVQTLKKHVTQY